MAHIKINELLRAPDMSMYKLRHNQTGEEQWRRVPAAASVKFHMQYDQDGNVIRDENGLPVRSGNLNSAWTEIPGLDANWTLVGFAEGVLSTDTDTGWLELEGDFFTDVGMFAIWVGNLIYTFELTDGYTIVRDAQNRITITPDPPFGWSVVDGFLNY